jgi:diguanylate cyclase (GGDEF)-like protein
VRPKVVTLVEQGQDPTGSFETDREELAFARVRPVYVGLGLLVVAYLVWLTVRPATYSSTLVDGWGVDAFELVTAALCFVSAGVRRQGRTVAVLFGLAALAWTLGDTALTVESLGGATPPVPSAADVFYLCFYPLAYAGIAVMMRRELRQVNPPSWLDGAVAGLGAAAVCSAFLFPSILHAAGGGRAMVITDLVYPAGDLVLLAMVAGCAALVGGGRKRPWVLLAVACAVNAAGDTANLFGTTVGRSVAGVTVNAIAWPVALLLISVMTWQSSRAGAIPGSTSRPAGLLLPGLATAAGLVILVVDSVYSVGRVATVLATATLLVAGIRLALSARALRAITEERHRQSVTDELTGLGNRRHLFDVLDTYFADRAAGRTQGELAFIFLDLDHFKEINDSFGHSAGDELLRQLGPRMSSSLRESDVLVRLGGDEFAVVLGDSDAEYAAVVADRLADSLKERFALELVTAQVSASMGIALAPADATDSAQLLRCADVAMYRAKVASATYAVYDPAIDDSGNLLQLADELRDAVGAGAFELHYQTQLDLSDGSVHAAEALLRWPHPRLGRVAPLAFLPLAEEVGLMPALTRWVLDQALAQCARWRVDGRPVIVSVNISATNLLDDGFFELVQNLLDDHGLPGHALVLELTETCIISDYERTRAVIAGLSGLGVDVSIDDFGAGFTSLAYLGDLDVAELKLDRSFITGIRNSQRDRDLVRSTISLGHALGLRVVAEGIEDQGTLNLLRAFGCDVVQGFFISRPVPACDVVFDGPPTALAPAPLLIPDRG